VREVGVIVDDEDVVFLDLRIHLAPNTSTMATNTDAGQRALQGAGQGAQQGAVQRELQGVKQGELQRVKQETTMQEAKCAVDEAATLLSAHFAELQAAVTEAFAVHNAETKATQTKAAENKAAENKATQTKQNRWRNLSDSDQSDSDLSDAELSDMDLSDTEQSDAEQSCELSRDDAESSDVAVHVPVKHDIEDDLAACLQAGEAEQRARDAHDAALDAAELGAALNVGALGAELGATLNVDAALNVDALNVDALDAQSVPTLCEEKQRTTEHDEEYEKEHNVQEKDCEQDDEDLIELEAELGSSAPEQDEDQKTMGLDMKHGDPEQQHEEDEEQGPDQACTQEQRDQSMNGSTTTNPKTSTSTDAPSTTSIGTGPCMQSNTTTNTTTNPVPNAVPTDPAKKVLTQQQKPPNAFGLLPMRCFTCLKPLSCWSETWEEWLRRRVELVVSDEELVRQQDAVLRGMGMTRNCCRCAFLTQPVVVLPHLPLRPSRPR
jgi:DNA-directed RNA polymerase subunit N (RpoN/RPB10)